MVEWRIFQRVIKPDSVSGEECKRKLANTRIARRDYVRGVFVTMIMHGQFPSAGWAVEELITFIDGDIRYAVRPMSPEDIEEFGS